MFCVCSHESLNHQITEAERWIAPVYSKKIPLLCALPLCKKSTNEGRKHIQTHKGIKQFQCFLPQSCEQTGGSWKTEHRRFRSEHPNVLNRSKLAVAALNYSKGSIHRRGNWTDFPLSSGWGRRGVWAPLLEITMEKLECCDLSIKSLFLVKRQLLME